MIKRFLPLILVLVLVSCSPSTESTDYFGQPYPDSIPVIFAPDIVSVKDRLEHGLSFSPDSRELAFGILNKDDFSGKIYYSKRIDNIWTEPVVFESLKDECVYLPYFSPDGESLLFAKSQPDMNNAYTDIWKIDRLNNDWGAPELLPTPLSSVNREANACMTNDGTIYFSSNRNCDGKENCYTADLFYSRLIDGEYQSVKEVSEFVSVNDEESVFISPNEDYIIFCRYTDNKTQMDLYISYRDINSNWIEPERVDSTINSVFWDRRPFISNDNKFLFFTRLQIGKNGLTESDIYWVNTTKLFKPFVYNSVSDITLKVGENFEMTIPTDYYRDIDDNRLYLSTNKDKIRWIEFNSEKMRLSGTPANEGEFELIFTATDEHNNKTLDTIKVTVVK